MDIEEMKINESLTFYNFAPDPNDSKSVRKWLDGFKEHHGLIGVTLKSIPAISEGSKKWTNSQLKRAVPLMCGYKSGKDSLFVPFFADDPQTPFGCLEVYDYKQLLRWKSFFPGHLHVKSINRFIS